MANVTVIPATKGLYRSTEKTERKRHRVAGYARVSTDSDEQFTSFAAQTDYYTKYINANPEWQFVRVYTDEGITATNTKHRDGFNEMIADALDGKIDLIVTKSVSRFARNTVDSLSTIRKLKEFGTEVYFEKENIWTFDSKGELLITIMSSLAQEESRSISENVTWGQRKRFADGKVNMPFSSFLGYKKGENGVPEIVPEEAETVKTIYRLFMQGKSVNAIAKYLMDKGIPSPRGKAVWQTTTIESILTNEKYKGDALLQKRFTIDFLQKKMKDNEGEVPQYYVEDSHPAIILKDEWELVQAEMAKRKSYGKHRNSISPFSSKLICGDCGYSFGSKVWHSTDKYRRVIWQCNGKYKGEKKCKTPHLNETDIKAAFVRAVNKLLMNGDSFIEDCLDIIAVLNDTSEIDRESETLSAELDTLTVEMERMIAENSSRAMDQDEYRKRYGEYEERFESAKKRYEELQTQKTMRFAEVKKLEGFIEKLRSKQSIPLEFDEDLWGTIIDHATVCADGTLTFTLKDGNEIKERI